MAASDRGIGGERQDVAGPVEQQSRGSGGTKRPRTGQKRISSEGEAEDLTSPELCYESEGVEPDQSEEHGSDSGDGGQTTGQATAGEGEEPEGEGTNAGPGKKRKRSSRPHLTPEQLSDLSGRVTVEYAKTDRSGCKFKGCASTGIGRGHMRLGRTVLGPAGYLMTLWYHPRCFLRHVAPGIKGVKLASKGGAIGRLTSTGDIERSELLNTADRTELQSMINESRQVVPDRLTTSYRRKGLSSGSGASGAGAGHAAAGTGSGAAEAGSGHAPPRGSQLTLQGFMQRAVQQKQGGGTGTDEGVGGAGAGTTQSPSPSSAGTGFSAVSRHTVPTDASARGSATTGATAVSGRTAQPSAAAAPVSQAPALTAAITPVGPLAFSTWRAVIEAVAAESSNIGKQNLLRQWLLDVMGSVQDRPAAATAAGRSSSAVSGSSGATAAASANGLDPVTALHTALRLCLPKEDKGRVLGVRERVLTKVLARTLGLDKTGEDGLRRQAEERGDLPAVAAEYWDTRHGHGAGGAVGTSGTGMVASAAAVSAVHRGAGLATSTPVVSDDLPNVQPSKRPRKARAADVGAADQAVTSAPAAPSVTATATVPVTTTAAAPLTILDVDAVLTEVSHASKDAEYHRIIGAALRRCTNGADVRGLCRLLLRDLRAGAQAPLVLSAVHPQAYESYKRSADLKAVAEQYVGSLGSGGGTAGGHGRPAGSAVAPAEPASVAAARLFSGSSRATGKGATAAGQQEADRAGQQNGHEASDAEDEDALSIHTTAMAMRPGVPIKPMLAQAVGSVGEGWQLSTARGGPVLAEVKYDGNRVQVHVQRRTLANGGAGGGASTTASKVGVGSSEGTTAAAKNGASAQGWSSSSSSAATSAGGGSGPYTLSFFSRSLKPMKVDQVALPARLLPRALRPPLTLSALPRDLHVPALPASAARVLKDVPTVEEIHPIRDAVFDGEVLMVDETGAMLPFGSLGTEKRKGHAASGARPCLFLFDCLYINGKPLLDYPLVYRRAVLERAVRPVPTVVELSRAFVVPEDRTDTGTATAKGEDTAPSPVAVRASRSSAAAASESQQTSTGPDALGSLTAEAIGARLEGLVVKDGSGRYEPAARRWVKLKRDHLGTGMADTVDLIVLGSYYGTGRYGSQQSVWLCGVRDPARPDHYLTVAKVGNGMTDADALRMNETYPMLRLVPNASAGAAGGESGAAGGKAGMGAGRDGNGAATTRGNSTTGGGVLGTIHAVPPWLAVSPGLTPDFVIADPSKAPVWEVSGFEFTESPAHTAPWGTPGRPSEAGTATAGASSSGAGGAAAVTGLSIRFPRLVRERLDKSPDEATTLPELHRLRDESGGHASGSGYEVGPTVGLLGDERDEDGEVVRAEVAGGQASSAGANASAFEPQGGAGPAPGPGTGGRVLGPISGAVASPSGLGRTVTAATGPGLMVSSLGRSFRKGVTDEAAAFYEAVSLASMAAGSVSVAGAASPGPAITSSASTATASAAARSWLDGLRGELRSELKQAMEETGAAAAAGARPITAFFSRAGSGSGSTGGTQA